MFRFSFRFTFHHLQPQRLALHSKNASTRHFSDSPSSHNKSATISIKHVATSSEIPPRKIIAPPFNTAIVKQVADKVRKLRSAIINSNNNNVASSSSSSSPIAANTTPQQLHHQNVQREQDYLRSCLDYFARNPSEFIEWCSNASIAALAHVVHGAEMAKVNPKTGRFVNQALIPALWYRFFGTNSPASSSSSSKSKNESQENLEKLSNIFRRLCDMRIYNFENFSSDESEKRDNSVATNQNIDSPLLTDTQKQKADVLKYLAEKIVCGIAGGVHFAEEEGNQAGKDSVMLTIKSINNVLPAIGEVLATFQGKNANENDNFRFLLTIANKLLKSADSSLLVLSLQPNPESTTDGASVCLLSTHDVFHLVRILRFAASHLVFLRQNQLRQQQCDLLLDVEASQAFFATCLNIIVDVPHHHHLRRHSQLHQNQQNFSRLRGSHLVTVLQSCAKVLSAVRERNFGTVVDGEDVDVDADKKQSEGHPINSSYFYDNLLQVSNTVVKKFDSLANDYFYQQSNSNHHGNNLSKSSSTLSLKVFDTSPAAVAKAALSIEIILQHLRRKNVENNDNVSKTVNTCVFAVLSADLHNMNAALFSVVAWCEFLSAIRLRNRSKTSAHNNNNHYNDGGDDDDDNVTNKLMSLVEANFMQIFRLALTSSSSNDDGVTVKHTESLSPNTSSSLSAAQLLLSVSYECHITNLDPLVIIECCQLIKNEKLSNNKFSNASFLLLNRDLTKLAVRVALRQLSSTTSTSSSEHPDAITTSLEQMRKELIALCSSSSSSLSLSACLEQGNDEIISPVVCSTSIDTIRNLIALGATLTDCEDLIVIALTPATASTTHNSSILPALSWFISTKQLVQFARTVCFCKLINLSTAPSVDGTVGKSNSKNSDSLVQKLLLERCELLVTIFSGSFLMGKKRKEKENHHRKIFSTVGECFVRAGIGPSSLLAEALASSFLSSSKDGTANFLIDSFKRFHDDGTIEEMKEGDATSRNLNEEFLFLCMCSEHVLFAPVQQHVFFLSNEETGINSEQMDLFDWVASKVIIIHRNFQHEKNDDDDDERIERENIANEMRRHFENVLWNININRLHNVVTAQLPFALSSKKLSSQGEDNFVRGRVMQKLLFSMVEEGKSKKISESYYDSNPVEHERIPAASASAWPNWKLDNFDNSL